MNELNDLWQGFAALARTNQGSHRTAPGKEFGITLNYYKSSMKVIVAGAGDEICDVEHRTVLVILVNQDELSLDLLKMWKLQFCVCQHLLGILLKIDLSSDEVSLLRSYC